MATTLGDIFTLIDDRRRDSTTNSITVAEKMRAVNSIIDIWQNLHDWPWTIKETQFNYNADIDTYPLASIASDFKTPLTIKPSKNNKETEFWMVSDLKFDSTQTKPTRFAITDRNRKQYLRVKANIGNATSIDTATQYDGNGTWVAAGGASAVGTDVYEGYTYSSSVKFTYTGTSGNITNSTFKQVDLSSYKDRSNVYLDVYIPEETNLTSISLKWGSDASNYFSVSATTDYLGRPFVEGWNRLKFVWATPTQVGTVNETEVDYLQVTIAYSVSPGTVVFRIQNIFVSENVPLTLTYYSLNSAYDVSGVVETQKFNDSTASTDYPLWSGRWDSVTEQFINSVIEILFWMTGEYVDKQIAQGKINEIVEPLKAQFPSKRRKPASFITTDTNY